MYRNGGRRITRRSEIERLDALAIPPAWSDVEISRSPSAKVLARGIDAAGRTQAIYHPAYRERRDHEKHDRVLRFARALPALRARVDQDLRRRALDRDRVVACVIRLIDRQFFRVGNAEYAKRNRSFGVTTLRDEHVRAGTETVEFDFVGKSGKRQRRRVRDPRVARLIRRLESLPGHELFRFLDEDGTVHDVDSRQVNAYVKRYAGQDFSAKDLRTWGATLVAGTALLELSADDLATPNGRAEAIRRIVRETADRLGNTPAVTKSSYIDPRVLDAAEHPRLLESVRRAKIRPRRYSSADEQRVIALVERVGRLTSR